MLQNSQLLLTSNLIILSKFRRMDKKQLLQKGHNFMGFNGYTSTSNLFQGYNVSFCSDQAEFQNFHQIQNDVYDGTFSRSYCTETFPSRKVPKKHKIELCRVYAQYGFCQYGELCMFAHGVEELSKNHPELRVRFCKNYYEKGYCKYGNRCNFRHDKPRGHDILNSSVNKNISQTKKQRQFHESLTTNQGNQQTPEEHVEHKQLKFRKDLAKAHKKLRLQKVLLQFPDILIPGYQLATKSLSNKSKLSFAQIHDTKLSDQNSSKNYDNDNTSTDS